MGGGSEALKGADPSLADIVRLLVNKISSYTWLKRTILYGLLGAVLLRLMRRKRAVRGKLCLITGSAGGIGREMALSFGRAGSKLALVDINAEMLEATAREVREATGAEVETYTCNLANKDAVYAMVDDVRARQGHVYCLVNNAGIISGAELMDTPDSRIELSMKVNVMAWFWTVKAVLPHMLEQNSGHIVGVSSAAGIFPNPKMVDYCTSKYAARGFMEALSVELQFLRRTGVGLSLVCPAHVNTALFKGYNVGFSMEPSYVAAQTLQAVYYNKFHVYLPFPMHMGVFWQAVMPKAIWDFFISFSFSAMKDWQPAQANQVFAKIGEK